MDEIYEQIAKVREKYADEQSQKEISALEKNLKRNDLIVKLKSHDGTKIILEEFNKEIELIEKELKTNVGLFKDKNALVLGQVLHARRSWLIKFTKMFSLAETNVQTALGTIKHKLTDED